MYPAGIPNRVTVKLQDGRIITKRADYSKGHHTNRLTPQEIELKFRPLTRKFLQEGQIERIMDFVWEIEKQPDVSKLMKLCVIKGR